MYCGCNAAAALTGWDRDQVWLHVRWLWEQRGERFGPHPRGGISARDILLAVERAGYTWEDVWLPLGRRRMRYGEFVRLVPDGNYLMHQNRHLFAHRRGRQLTAREARAMIVGAWRIARK